MAVSLGDIPSAARTLRGIADTTPLMPSLFLSARIGTMSGSSARRRSPSAPSSLADSLGGGVGPRNRLTRPLCRDLLGDIVPVGEEEMCHAMQVPCFEDRLMAIADRKGAPYAA